MFVARYLLSIHPTYSKTRTEKSHLLLSFQPCQLCVKLFIITAYASLTKHLDKDVIKKQLNINGAYKIMNNFPGILNILDRI